LRARAHTHTHTHRAARARWRAARRAAPSSARPAQATRTQVQRHTPRAPAPRAPAAPQATQRPCRPCRRFLRQDLHFGTSKASSFPQLLLPPERFPVSIRQHTSAYVSIRQRRPTCCPPSACQATPAPTATSAGAARTHLTSGTAGAHVSIRQRQHTSAFVSVSIPG
jgi:hypothetical protein